MERGDAIIPTSMRTCSIMAMIQILVIEVGWHRCNVHEN